MDVDVRDLELLEAIDRHQTLTAAANQLYVSQPALSQRLVRLEQRLGTALFERGRRLVPTDAGRRMLRAARVTLVELRTAVHEVGGDARTAGPDTVRIWTQCSTNFQWLPPVLRTFRQRLPSADVAVAVLDAQDPVGPLLSGEIDVALVTKLGQELDRVRLHHLFDDELLAIVASDHPWASQPYASADDFSQAHLVLFDSYDPERAPAIPLPTPDGVPPRKLTLLPLMTELVLETVVTSDAVTVLPSWIAGPYLAGGRVTGVQVGPQAEGRTWYAATRRGGQPEPVRVLVDVLTAASARGDHLRPYTPAA